MLWLRIACSVIALSAWLADLPTAKSSPRPSFLVILCDDLGYGDLGCYGHPQIRTPNLDALAAQGLRLTQCYSAAPVCSPSRAGLLTGRTPSRIGIYDWIPAGHAMHLPREEVTIAALLQHAGYETCHVGKWHLNGRFNSPAQPQPSDHGFDYWFSTQNNAAPSHKNPTNFVRNGAEVGPLEGYSCDLVADEAVRWLRTERETEQPFFLFVCFHEPHEPIASPPELVAEYAAAELPGQAEYFANVANMDRAVGRLLAALDELQLAEETLVWFTSDNGPETLNRYRGAERSQGSAGPLRGQKLHLYEGGIRVPGIVRFPSRVASGAACDIPICGVDLLPTCCALAGISLPSDRTLDGADASPALFGADFQRTRPLFWHYFRSLGAPKAALRLGDCVLLAGWDGPQLGPGGSLQQGDLAVIRSSHLSGYELYNLRDDLAQEHDLTATEQMQLAELQPLLNAAYAEVQAAGRDWDSDDE